MIGQSGEGQRLRGLHELHVSCNGLELRCHVCDTGNWVCVAKQRREIK